jgi:protein ImuA
MNCSLQQLVKRIEEIEASERLLVQAPVPLTMPGLTEAFPGGCLPAGALVEVWSVAEGGGAWTLALLLAKQACVGKKILVVADARRSFYPPAAARLGIDLGHTLVLRTKEHAHALAALAQSLRCPAVAAVIGEFDRLTSAEYRRLQLAAETGGGVGFLVRSAAARGGPSFAAVRLLVTPSLSALPTAGKRGTETRRLIQVEVLRLRGDKAGRALVLEIDHETGHVRVPAAMAAATAVARAAGAPG